MSGERESHRLVSRLARRAFSALRLPPIAQASATKVRALVDFCVEITLTRDKRADEHA
jgi:hypothetical protein